MKTQFDRPPWLAPYLDQKNWRHVYKLWKKIGKHNITFYVQLLVENFNVTTIELKYNYAALGYLPFFYEYIKFLKR